MPLATPFEGGSESKDSDDGIEELVDNVAVEEGDIHSDMLCLLELDKVTMRADPYTVELVGRRYGDPSARGKSLALSVPTVMRSWW